MMKEKMIKLWMVAMGLLLSVQAFSYGEDRPWDIYEDDTQFRYYDPRHPIVYSLMDPRHWFQDVGYECRRQVRVIDPFVVCAYGHYWQEDTKTCNNFASLLYATPEYIDSVTKKTGGILTFPDTIHIGPPDSIGLCMVPKDVGDGFIMPWPTDVKIGNVYSFETAEGFSQSFLTPIRRIYGIENLQRDTANLGKIKYYRVNRSVYDEKCNKTYKDTLLTGCYMQLPMMAFDVKDGITSITAYTFWKCPNLMKVNMPQSLVNIERSAFEGCIQLDNVTLPDSVRIIGASAFKGCTQLQNIALSPTVFSMEGYAFEGCVRLKNITLPDSLRDIGVYAFAGCSSLDSITFPENLKFVGTGFLSDCENLRTVVMKSKNPPYISDRYDYEQVKNETLVSPMAVIYVPKGCAEAYRKAEGWSEMKERIFEVGDPAAQEYINGIHAVKTEQRNSAAYDLQGRRVDADRLQRGSIYIENGKKISK